MTEAKQQLSAKLPLYLVTTSASQRFELLAYNGHIDAQNSMVAVECIEFVSDYVVIAYLLWNFFLIA